MPYVLVDSSGKYVEMYSKKANEIVTTNDSLLAARFDFKEEAESLAEIFNCKVIEMDDLFPIYEPCADCKKEIHLEKDRYYFFEPTLKVYCEDCCQNFGVVAE